MRTRWIVVLGAALSLGILGLRFWLRPGATPAASATAAPEFAADLPRPLQAGDAIPDARLVDQDGREFHLAELRGEVLVLAFIYTHCDVMSMCPTTTTKMVRARNLLRERGVRGVTFLLLSFDPERDRPQRLRAYAATKDAGDILLASGAGDEIRSLARALNTYYRADASGVFEHNVVVSVIDRAGRLRDDLFGTTWEPEELVRAVEKLGPI